MTEDKGYVRYEVGMDMRSGCQATLHPHTGFIGAIRELIYPNLGNYDSDERVSEMEQLTDAAYYPLITDIDVPPEDILYDEEGKRLTLQCAFTTETEERFENAILALVNAYIEIGIHIIKYFYKYDYAQARKVYEDDYQIIGDFNDFKPEQDGYIFKFGSPEVPKMQYRAKPHNTKGDKE